VPTPEKTPTPRSNDDVRSRSVTSSTENSVPTGAVSVDLSFRARLMTIVGATGMAFLLVILVSWLIGLREERKLAGTFRGGISRHVLTSLVLGGKKTKRR